jgi:dipeptidyl aminopeptidase/acylaminoacyl peptidase
MRSFVRFSLIATLLTSTAALADDRIQAPPADLAPAYSHPHIAATSSTRALAVSRDGTFAAYVVEVPVAHPAASADMFLPTGAPTFVAQGARIMLLDLRTRATQRICASAGNDWDPVWSPDGHRLAFYSDRDGATRLWIYDRASQACRRVAERPAKSLLWAHEEPRWSADGRNIYFSVWPEAGPGAPQRARVALTPNAAPTMAAGEVAVYRHDPAVAAAPAARPTAMQTQSFEARCGLVGYVAASIAVVAADGSDPARLLVDADAQSRPEAQHRHFPTPYFRLSASGRWITYFDSACTQADDAHRMTTRLFAVPAAGGAPILIADNLRAAVGGGENILGYRWSPRADTLVFTRDGALWRVDFGPDGPGAPQRLAQSLGPLSPALDWYSEDGAMVLVGTNPVQTGRGNAPFEKDIDLALQAAGDRLVGIYEDFRTPANLFAFSRDLDAPIRLSDVAPDLRAAAAGQAVTFETTIPQFDGTLKTVHTAVLLPEGAQEGDKLPAVVWIYPGEDLTARLAMFGAPGMGDPAYLLTSRGYAVILADVAIGPGEQRGHVIDEIMDSLLPQVYRAADLGYVDIGRLAVRGQSFGGFATAAVIARTNLFRAAVASSGIYDLGGSYADTNFIRGQAVDNSDWAENSQPRLGQPVWDDPLRYIENSPYYLADRIRTPLLILQGTADFVGVRESGKLFSALRRLDRPVELALYAGGGHSPAHFPPAQAVDQMARTIEFLRVHIGPGWAPGQARQVSTRRPSEQSHCGARTERRRGSPVSTLRNCQAIAGAATVARLAILMRRSASLNGSHPPRLSGASPTGDPMIGSRHGAESAPPI